MPAKAGIHRKAHKNSVLVDRPWVPAGVYPREGGGGNDAGTGHDFRRLV
jgi:hypothetical protein